MDYSSALRIDEPNHDPQARSYLGLLRPRSIVSNTTTPWLVLTPFLRSVDTDMAIHTVYVKGTDRILPARLRIRSRTKPEAAYARSDLFEKRRALMESWAAYLAG